MGAAITDAGRITENAKRRHSIMITQGAHSWSEEGLLVPIWLACPDWSVPGKCL